MTIHDDLLELYAAAHERMVATRAAWIDGGCLLTGEGSMGQQVEAPLHKILRDSERHVVQLAEACERKGIGRPQLAVVRPGGSSVSATEELRKRLGIPDSQRDRVRRAARKAAAKGA